MTVPFEQHPQRLDVRGVRVVAEEVSGIRGGGADHGHGANRACERQGAVVPEEDEALARRHAGEPALRRRIARRRGPARVDVRLFEQPELELRSEHAPHGGVHHRL